MRACVPDYELATPGSLPHALALRAQGWKPFAGGTDLMVLLEAGKLTQRRFLNIWNLAELRGIEVSPGVIRLGALTTYTEVRRHSVLRQEFPLLCQAARETGGIATQNRGTLGGNIVNASPAADSPPALLVYDAELELISPRGVRRLPYGSFHTGYKQMALAPDELLQSIYLPRGAVAWRQYYRKIGTRKAQAISKLCFAGLLSVEDGEIRDVRIALGSVAPVPLRCRRTEAVLRGQPLEPDTVRRAQSELGGEISPSDDFRSTAAYRRRVALNLLEEFLR